MGRCRNVVFYSILHSQCLRCLCCLSEEYKEQTAKENSDNAGQPALFNYRLRYIRFTIFVLTLKWTHPSRQLFSEFKLCPCPPLQLVGAAP